jgi:shikimate kinase
MAEKMHTADFVPGALAKASQADVRVVSADEFHRRHSLEEVLERLQTAAGAEAKVRSRVEMQSALKVSSAGDEPAIETLLDEDRLSALEI